MNDERLRLLLLRLVRAEAHSLRNRVVHKDAYRPTLAEAERVYKEAREILFGIAARLGLGYDLTWYLRTTGR